MLNPGVVGTIDDIPSIVRDARRRSRRRQPGRCARQAADGQAARDEARRRAPSITCASVYEEYTGKIAVENLRPSWLIFSTGFRKSRAAAAAKRVLDVDRRRGRRCLLVRAADGCWSPLAVKLTSRGPVLYHQQRVGQHGRVFTVHKFRSMRQDAEAETGPVWAARRRSARDAVGRFLRRTRLDELPQLWNVLSGDMSFVGPRPERPEFVAELTEQIPFYGQRHVVRPGSPAGRRCATPTAPASRTRCEKLQYDLFYIKNLSSRSTSSSSSHTVKTVVLQQGA